MSTRSILAAFLLAAAFGCASAPPRAGMTMPSPDGCFVQVYDGARFTGRRDFINGPVGYATLRNMPGRQSWEKRIRSLRVGPSARVTIWTEENFGGTPLFLTTESAQPAFPAAMTAQIRSMNVDCDQATDPAVRQAAR